MLAMQKGQSSLAGSNVANQMMKKRINAQQPDEGKKINVQQ
jgi:hypothetical protein